MKALKSIVIILGVLFALAIVVTLLLDLFPEQMCIRDRACVAGNLGGTVRLSFGCAKFFQALHGGGAAGCPACGLDVYKRQGHGGG